MDDDSSTVLTTALGSQSVTLELEATGYAQVLVILTESSAPQPAALAWPQSGRKGRSSENALAAAPDLLSLERYFTVAAESQDAALASTRVYSALQNVRLSVRTATDIEPQSILEDVATAVATDVPKARLYANLGVILGTVDRSGFVGLKADPRVQEVQPAPQLSLIRPTNVSSGRTRKGISWGPTRMNVPALWDAGITGANVLVGHLDTGVDASHPALGGAVTAFAEFDFLGKPIEGASPRDSETHGTHTAGIIVGRKIGTTQFGVAPGALLASAMVIEGGNIGRRVLAGLDCAVGLEVRVLTMSLGLRGYNPAFLTLTSVIRPRGVLPVFAVGHEGPGTSRSPGHYVEALSVGACDTA